MKCTGVLFSGCQFPLPGDFAAELERVHGSEPSETFPAQYADAATALLDAIKQVAQPGDDGSLTMDPRALRDAVRATSLQSGLSGAIAFDTNGDRVPEPGVELSDFQGAASDINDIAPFVTLGLIPCQVQDGRLVPLAGPTARDVRLPEAAAAQ